MDEKYGMLRKGLIVLAIPFVLQLIFLSILLKSQFDNAASQTLAIHTKDVIAEEEGLSKRLVMLRNNMLGLAMSGNVGLNPFDSLADEIRAGLEGLKVRVRDNEPADGPARRPDPPHRRVPRLDRPDPRDAPHRSPRRRAGADRDANGEADAGRHPARSLRVSSPRGGFGQAPPRRAQAVGRVAGPLDRPRLAGHDGAGGGPWSSSTAGGSPRGSWLWSRTPGGCPRGRP